MADQPVALIEYNTYVYTLVKKILSSGRIVTVLQQSDLPETSEQIFDFDRIVVSQSLGFAADSLQITLNNEDGKYTDKFLPFQEIVIYVGFPSDPNNISKTELQKLFVGLIDSADVKYDKQAGHVISILGRNYAAPLLDNKVTATFIKRTSTQIVKELVEEFGIGLKSEISDLSKRLINKRINTGSVSSFEVLKKRTSSDVHMTTEVQTAVSTFNKTSLTTGDEDFLYKNKTVWDAIENLAYHEAEVTGDNSREFIAYIGGSDGKTLYFGPRRAVENDPTNLIHLIVGQNIKEYQFSLSTQYLKTRVRMRSVKTRAGLATGEELQVVIPDDLVPIADIDPQELEAFKALQRLFGIREIVLQDRDKVWAVGTQKLKAVGIAKLREYARLTYTGSVSFTFLSDLDNIKIGQLTRDQAVFVAGIPVGRGDLGIGFEPPQSKRFNGIYYIEKATHTISKSDGYNVDLQLSSRKPERTQALSNTSVSTKDVIVGKTSLVTRRDIDQQIAKTD